MKTLSSIAAVVVVMCLSGCVFESFEAPGIFVAPDASMDAGDTGGEAGDVGTQDVGPADVGATDAADMSVPDASDVDASDMSVADMGDDAGADMSSPDMGCSGVIDEIPESFGDETCQVPALQTPGMCDPVYQTGCDPGQRCGFQIVLENGMPSYFVTTCTDFSCERAVKVEGEACGAGECQPGLECNQSVCKRRCELQDSQGCQTGQVCVRQSSISRTYGFCADNC